MYSICRGPKTNPSAARTPAVRITKQTNAALQGYSGSPAAERRAALVAAVALPNPGTADQYWVRMGSWVGSLSTSLLLSGHVQRASSLRAILAIR
jgi:hypothetical protein